ncbi:MAG TPA: hypothetical protein VF160_01330 [Candidatus Dormibacteraeota bacterium]
MATLRRSGIRFLNPLAVTAVVLALGAIAAGFSHLPPFWGGALALLAGVFGYTARRRLIKVRRPTVDEVRSLVLAVLAILLAMAGFALVAPALLLQAQQRLPH